MVLARKSMAELEKLIADMSTEQFKALHSDICEKLYPEMTLDELNEARDRITGLIEAAQEQEREKFLAEARVWADKAKQMGLDLGSALGVSPAARRARAANGSSTDGDGRSKAEIQIRNPKDHTEIWSLRGRKPRWLIRELATKGIDGDKAKNTDIPAEYWAKNQ